jgi:acetyl esterase/lipase
VHDVFAALQFLRAGAGSFKTDPERIGLMGASAGAHLAALAALGRDTFKGAYPNDAQASASAHVKALVGVYGIYDSP